MPDLSHRMRLRKKDLCVAEEERASRRELGTKNVEVGVLATPQGSAEAAHLKRRSDLSAKSDQPVCAHQI